MEVAIASDAVLGESPRWDAAAARLLWVDIERGLLHVSQPQTGLDETVQLPGRVGFVAPVDAATVVVGLADRIASLQLADGALTTLAPLGHGPELRVNDGTCDSAGRLWFGTMALDETPGAGAFFVLAGGELRRVFGEVTISNGTGWSPDGTLMYYVDSGTQRVDVFDFDPGSGAISGRRPFVSIRREDGIPDGLTVDAAGGLWLALYGGGCVRRYGADGSLDAELAVPARNPTACCLAGRRLYVTTAAQGDRSPRAGCVFAADVAVAGPPARVFGG